MANLVDLKGEDESLVDELAVSTWSVVDFYANWCGPCKLAGKTFSAVAEDWPDESVRFIKVDTEVLESTVDEYGLKGLPVFGVFKDGQLVEKHEGNLGKAKMIEFLNKCID